MKEIEVKDIAMWEETDSELAKYTIQELNGDNMHLKSYLKNIEQVNKVLYERIDKAIEYTNELIADTKCMLDDMKYQDKEETITRFVEDLEKDIKNYEHQISILRGDDNE